MRDLHKLNLILDGNKFLVNLFNLGFINFQSFSFVRITDLEFWVFVNENFMSVKLKRINLFLSNIGNFFN